MAGKGVAERLERGGRREGEERRENRCEQSPFPCMACKQMLGRKKIKMKQQPQPITALGCVQIAFKNK